MKGLDFLLLQTRQSSCFATVLQSTYTGTININHFVRKLNFSLPQTLAVSRAKVPETLLMRQLISVSNDAFDAMLKLRYTKFILHV